MTEVLKRKNIITGCVTEGHEDVIRRTGAMLVAEGYVGENYITGMLKRDRDFSTAIGNGIAIPHGTKEFKNDIIATGLVVLTYPQGVAWNDGIVKLVVGIAAKGDEHIEILERLVEAFEDESAVDEIVAAADAEKIYQVLTQGN
ncbi:MAG: PTS sugar transporter subunit IIA [Planctomycetota bacterium]|jgi:mannitol/fructose-specific phosphotransferase system IIA component|nr:PTS sugar transporter subunit IIA [Planctomycetota bacterium]